MSENTTYKYQTYCETEQKYVSVWVGSEDSTPNACPNGADHIISGSWQIIDKIVSNTVVIKSSRIVNNNYMFEGFNIDDIQPNTTKSVSISFPYDIAIICGTTEVSLEQRGDFMNIIIAPNTMIGVLTSDVTENSNILNVSQTVIDNVSVGFEITLNDMINQESLGRITSIDKVNRTITTAYKTVNSYSADPFVQVLLNIYKIKNLRFMNPCEMKMKGLSTETSMIPKNTKIKVLYTNNSSTVVKNISIYFEYLY